mgnify:CR=1 FL=1
MSIRFSDFGRKLNNDSKRSAARRFNESINTSSSREALFSGEFQIGSVVESEGKTQEVLDIRSNYLVLIDDTHNCFLNCGCIGNIYFAVTVCVTVICLFG